jgi:hypothetical protein
MDLNFDLDQNTLRADVEMLVPMETTPDGSEKLIYLEAARRLSCGA